MVRNKTNIHVGKIITIYKLRAARNLPKTTSKSVTGDVIRVSIVPDFVSSAKSFMVITGVSKRRKNWIESRLPFSDASCQNCKLPAKKNPEAIRKTEITTYAIGE
jgi:hypothetical protein